MNKFQVNMRQENIPAMHKRASYYSEANQEFAVTYTPVKQGIFNIYLMGDIESASQFIPAIEVLSAATPADEVFVHLSTNGGSLDATDTFIDAMRKCEAKIVAVASGGVHSCGTLILLNADEFSLSKHANFLIHSGSAGSYGKTSDFISQSAHTISYMTKVLRSAYKHFLTEPELDQLIEGKDFWLDAQEFGTRYEARNQALMEEFEAEQEAAEEVTQAAIENAAKLPKPKKVVVK